MLAWVRSVAGLIGNYAISAFQRATASGLIFAAGSPLGRSVKIFLFCLGFVLPLGSLIWVALIWHGNAVSRAKVKESSGGEPRNRKIILCDKPAGV